MASSKCNTLPSITFEPLDTIEKPSVLNSSPMKKMVAGSIVLGTKVNPLSTFDEEITVLDAVSELNSSELVELKCNIESPELDPDIVIGLPKNSV